MAGLLSTVRFCSRVGWPRLGSILEAVFLIISVRVFQGNRTNGVWGGGTGEAGRSETCKVSWRQNSSFLGGDQYFSYQGHQHIG